METHGRIASARTTAVVQPLFARGRGHHQEIESDGRVEYPKRGGLGTHARPAPVSRQNGAAKVRGTAQSSGRPGKRPVHEYGRAGTSQGSKESRPIQGKGRIAVCHRRKEQ